MSHLAIGMLSCLYLRNGSGAEMAIVEPDVAFFLSLESSLHRPDVRSSRLLLASLLADDFVEFGSSGREYDKVAVIDALLQEAPSDHSNLPQVQDFDAKQMGSDVVLVRYRSIRRSSDAPDRVTLRSSIWRMIDGRWQMLFHQGTPAPSAARPAVPTLSGGSVVLRAATMGDVEARLALGNDPNIFSLFGVSREDVRPMTRERAEQWVRHALNRPHAWVIEIDGALAGEIRLDNVNHADRRASMAVGIYNPDRLGKGYGSEAIRLLLQYAFGDMNLHRVSVRVLAHNCRAVRAYKKCGFMIEGRERGSAFVDGAWHDDLMMGIIRDDFRKARLA